MKHFSLLLSSCNHPSSPSDPGALIPPPVVRQQLQHMVPPQAGVNPNTLDEITQQETVRRIDNLEYGVLGLLRLLAPAKDLLARRSAVTRATRI
ncbi:hypothetical protein PGT21_015267 [Puccinia graminis f. sp. tritici]|uniref:Uncharacterized protein n=1 Tax=Puccinia graminis f. sp. tritici TaxID=56615 RepID=A0A5B0MXL7_PUCGR|nr:hypothetical protein PGT21_015267 [Puccinia graminis f. sp. tritici]